MSTQAALDIPEVKVVRTAKFKSGFLAAAIHGMELADYLALPENQAYKMAYEAYHRYRAVWRKINGNTNPTRDDVTKRGDPELFGFEIHFAAMRVAAMVAKMKQDRNGRVVPGKLARGEATQRYTEMVEKADRLPPDKVVAGLLGVSAGAPAKIRERLTEKGYVFMAVRGGWKVAARPAPTVDLPAPAPEFGGRVVETTEQPRFGEAEIRKMARQEAARLIVEVFGPGSVLVDF